MGGIKKSGQHFHISTHGSIRSSFTDVCVGGLEASIIASDSA